MYIQECWLVFTAALDFILSCFLLVGLRVVQIGLQYGGMVGINLGWNRVSLVCNWLKWGRPWVRAPVRSIQRLKFLRIAIFQKAFSTDMLLFSIIKNIFSTLVTFFCNQPLPQFSCRSVKTLQNVYTYSENNMYLTVWPYVLVTFNPLNSFVTWPFRLIHLNMLTVIPKNH